MKPIKVLIIDDSALIRQVFQELLSADPNIQIIGTAADPIEARALIKQLNPDVLTLDIEMPKMDGLSFLEKVMTLRPMPVIMASTLTQKGADAALRALELGAFDYVAKPISNHTRETLSLLGEALIAKVYAAASSKAAHIQRRRRVLSSHLRYYPPTRSWCDIIAIGASTGGVEALRDVLVALPENLPPIVITQHMPEHFTRSFAARLDRIAQLHIHEAIHGDRLTHGNVYIAPGNQHLRVARNGSDYIAMLDSGPPVSNHRPSVDVMFASVADAAGARSIGAILTGMGKDGAQGLHAMRTSGARTIGQDETSCVVYGMPKAAQEIGAVERQWPLSEIPYQILSLCEQSKEAVCRAR